VPRNQQTAFYFMLIHIHSQLHEHKLMAQQAQHTRLVDKPIHDALRLVTGCLHPTPIHNRFVLADITPTDLRRKRATLSLFRRAMTQRNFSTIDSYSHQLYSSENSNRGTLLYRLHWNYRLHWKGESR